MFVIAAVTLMTNMYKVLYMKLSGNLPLPASSLSQACDELTCVSIYSM